MTGSKIYVFVAFALISLNRRQAVVCGDSEKTGGDVTRRSTGIPVSTVQKTSAVREREEVRQSNEGKATSGQGHQGTKSEPRPVPVQRVDREEQVALKALDSLLRTYDRRSTPSNDLGVPTNVSLQLYVASLSSINTENMDYVADTYLRQRWLDPRLAHQSIKSTLDLSDPLLVKAIWKPEVFFPNAKEANFQFVTVPNVLIRIYPKGEILYILRLRLKFSCMMELSKYPLDTQICQMQISSFSKTTKELLLSWDEGSDSEGSAVSVAEDLRMPQFEMQKITTNLCHETKYMGNYSCLVAEFHLHRSIGFHLIQSYLPSILIVSISWVSFWMDVDCVPARVTLGVITLLTVSSRVSGTSVPQTSYVKAIDVWMGVCTAFVFAALVEFTFVNYMWRKSTRVDHHSQHGVGGDQRKPKNSSTFFTCLDKQGDIELDMVDHADHCVGSSIFTNDCDGSTANDLASPAGNGKNGTPVSTQRVGASGDVVTSPMMPVPGAGIGAGVASAVAAASMAPMVQIRRQARVRRIDEVCRFAFPAGFGLFNLFYWYYYQDAPDVTQPV